MGHAINTVPVGHEQSFPRFIVALSVAAGVLALSLGLPARADFPVEVPTDADYYFNRSSSAAKLVAAGEQILLPSSLHYAYDLFMRAERLDPSNISARFYVKSLAPRMALMGMTKRLRPLIARLPQRYQDGLNNNIRSFANDGYAEFLEMSNGRPDFQSDADLQEALKDIFIKQEEFRRFLQAEKGVTIPVRLYYGTDKIQARPDADDDDSESDQTSVIFNSRKREYYEQLSNCRVITDGGNRYIVQECPQLALRKVNIERADAEELVLRTATQEFMLAPLIAYDIDGLTGALDLKYTFKGSDRDIALYLKGIPEFGILRDPRYLQMTQVLGGDFVSSITFKLTEPKQNCPSGKGKYNQRPNNLFVDGSCPSNDFSDVIHNKRKKIAQFDELEAAKLTDVLAEIRVLLTGTTTYRYEYDKTTKAPFKTNFRPTAPYVSPVQDLKVALPNTFNLCGNAKSYGDPTFLGIYPDRDANYVLLRSGQLDRECKPE